MIRPAVADTAPDPGYLPSRGQAKAFFGLDVYIVPSPACGRGWPEGPGEGLWRGEKHSLPQAGEGSCLVLKQICSRIAACTNTSERLRINEASHRRRRIAQAAARQARRPGGARGRVG